MTTIDRFEPAAIRPASADGAPGDLVGGDLKLAGRLDARFFALLTAIDETGSINKAASAASCKRK